MLPRLLTFLLPSVPVLLCDFLTGVLVLQDHRVYGTQENTFCQDHRFCQRLEDFETQCGRFPSVFQSKHDHMSKNERYEE